MKIFVSFILIFFLLLRISCHGKNFSTKISNKAIEEDFICHKLMLFPHKEWNYFNKNFKILQLKELFCVSVDNKLFNKTVIENAHLHLGFFINCTDCCNCCHVLRIVVDMSKNEKQFCRMYLFCYKDKCIKSNEFFLECKKNSRDSHLMKIVIFDYTDDFHCFAPLKEMTCFINFGNNSDNGTSAISRPYSVDNKGIDLNSKTIINLFAPKNIAEKDIIDNQNLNYLFYKYGGVRLSEKNKINLLKGGQIIDSSSLIKKNQSQNWVFNFREKLLNKKNSFILIGFLTNCKSRRGCNCSSAPRTFHNSFAVPLFPPKHISNTVFRKRKGLKTHPFTSRSNSSVSLAIISLLKNISSAFTTKVKRNIAPYNFYEKLSRTKINKGVLNEKLGIIKKYNNKKPFLERGRRDNKYFPQKKKKQIDLKNGTAFREPFFIRKRNERSRKEILRKRPVKNNARRKRSANFIPKEDSLAYLDPFFPSEEDEKELLEEQNEILETKQSEIEALRVNSLEPSRKTHLRHLRSKRRKVAASVRGVEGESTLLPCDVSSRIEGDTPLLLMWFREGTHTPLFSVDFRQGPTGYPQIGSDKSSEMAERGTLHVSKESPYYSWTFIRPSNTSERGYEHFTSIGGNLEVKPTSRDDEGVFKCRVDFLHSPTRNERVNLTVIIPPQILVIEWRQNGEWVPVSGAAINGLIEGETLNVACRTSPAWPSPKVSWTSNNIEIDNSFQILEPQHLSGVKSSSNKPLKGAINHLQILHLTRSDHLRQINCEAINNNLSRPITTSLTLSLALPVLKVSLTEPKKIKIGQSIESQCTAWGSHPPPIINWKLGDQEIEASQFTVWKDGNITISVVKITPTIHQNGRKLTCFAYNAILQARNIITEEEWMKDFARVHVEFPPKVKASLGKSLNASRIKEGDDVYFECDVKANPPPHLLFWTHEGKKVRPRTGIFLTNGTLVIQGVNVSLTGNYICFVENTEGKAESKPVRLTVKFAPKCSKKNLQQFSIAKFEKARIPCDLEANPTLVHFHWSFNNTAELVDVPKDRYSSNHTRSILNYTPMNELDYGTLLCWGSNEIGKQIFPCVFHIKAAGKPEPPHNCDVIQATLSSLRVTCLPGSDGGDPQVFHLQVLQVSVGRKMAAEVTNSSPDFFAANLQPDTKYRLLITAANRRGESHPARQLLAKTAKLGSPRQETNAEATRGRKSEENDKIKVIMGVTLASVSATITILLLTVWICVRLKYRRRARERSNLTQAETSDEAETEFKEDNTSQSSRNRQFLSNETDPKVALIDIHSKTKSSNLKSTKCDLVKDAMASPSASFEDPLLSSSSYHMSHTPSFYGSDVLSRKKSSHTTAPYSHRLFVDLGDSNNDSKLIPMKSSVQGDPSRVNDDEDEDEEEDEGDGLVNKASFSDNAEISGYNGSDFQKDSSTYRQIPYVYKAT